MGGDSAVQQNMKGERETAQGLEELPLSKAVLYLLEECRMVLPGIQALFGFQLIAVFNTGFSQKLGPLDQRLHLTAIGLTALAVALIMTPAAYHRQTGPRQVTAKFIRVSTRLLLCSMWPLAMSICVDFFLISRIILGLVSAAIMAVVLFLVFVVLWFGLPRLLGADKKA